MLCWSFNYHYKRFCQCCFIATSRNYCSFKTHQELPGSDWPSKVGTMLNLYPKGHCASYKFIDKGELVSIDMNDFWEFFSLEAFVAEFDSSKYITSWLAFWSCSFSSRRVASASSILYLRDFSLALARHSSSSFCFLNTYPSNSLSLCSSASLAFEELGS